MGSEMCIRDRLSEPLYGVYRFRIGDPDTRVTDGYVLDELIYTPGHIQEATINVGGALAKAFDITPFNHTPTGAADDSLFDANNSDDVIFGGLGGDFLHGGSGDDAMSGAEAMDANYTQRLDGAGVIRSDWTRPYNRGNALDFGADNDAWHTSNQNEDRVGEFALYDE